MPGGNIAMREVVEHYGAVAVVAMDDEQQHRRWSTSTAIRSGRRLWELPAGSARRRGEEPAHRRRRGSSRRRPACSAEHWQVLVDLDLGPGLQRRIGAGLSGHRPERGRTTRGARRRSRHDDAVVSARRRRRAGAARRDREFHCRGRDSGRPRGVRRGWPSRARGRAVDRQADRVRARKAGAMTSRRPPWMTQLQGYLDHLTIERGVAANTLSSYRPGPAPLLQAPGGPRGSTIWPRSPRTTSASSWWRCGAAIPTPARCRCRRCRRRGP